MSMRPEHSSIKVLADGQIVDNTAIAVRPGSRWRPGFPLFLDREHAHHSVEAISLVEVGIDLLDHP
jgi:hypothetical protein